MERDKKYSAIEDYLSEYCNFGCAYFVLRKVTKAELKEKETAVEDSEGPDDDEVRSEEAGVADAAATAGVTDAPEVQVEETVEEHEGTKDNVVKNKTFASFKRGQQ